VSGVPDAGPATAWRIGAAQDDLRSSTPTGGNRESYWPDRPLRRYACSPPMTINQTTDAFDTAELELELAPATAAPAAEVEQDQPIWTPDDGDFN
jgi:hypothetical protein